MHKAHLTDAQSLRGFILATFAFLAIFASTAVPIPLYADYQVTIGLTTADISNTMFTYLTGVSLTLFLAGRVSDSLGRVPVASLTVMLAVFGCIMFLRAGSGADVLAARFVQGLAAGFGMSAVSSLVIDCVGLAEGAAITMEHIRRYGDKAEKADFLLFRLGWDKKWGTDAYFGDYPCIDSEVLSHIKAGNYKGIGFDVIGLDPIADVNLTRHRELFRDTEIVNIENLKNLELCGEELFWFSCFPLKLENCDGSPIRAVAWFE